jgi:mannose-6-phosphate isomerase
LLHDERSFSKKKAYTCCELFSFPRARLLNQEPISEPIRSIRMGASTMTEAMQRESFAPIDSKALLLQLYNTSVLPIKVDKPWGYELVYACTDKYVGKILHVKKGHMLSLQYHNHKQESNLLFKGKLMLIKGPNVLEEKDATLSEIEPRLVKIQIEEGFTWTNMPGDIHTIQAIEDADVLEVSTPELDDVVRLKDGYGRGGTSKP